MAFVTTVEFLGRTSVDMCDTPVASRQAAIERQYMEEQYMLSRAYADPPIGKFLAPMPPPPPVSSSRKRNKRLLLCHP